MKKILIIEFNDFHEEVLLSQVNYLKNNKDIKIYLYINEKLKSKLNFEKFNINICYINSKNRFTKIFSIFKILKVIKKEKIDHIVFNTFESIYVLLIKSFLKNQKKFFIVHNVDKFKCKGKKNSQFLVLNETLKKYTIKNYNKCNFDYFYPLIIVNELNNLNNKKKTEIKIIIPGLVELNRRDYLGFLKLINNVDLDNIKFVFLGNILKNDGPLVYKKLKECDLLKKVKVYKNFVPYEEYFREIANSDLIMPLIHPGVKNFEKYHYAKITAAFSMAFSFKKPLLLYKSLADLEEFKNISISYDINNLVKILRELDKNIINNLENKIKNTKKFSWEYQKDRYKRIIFE